jgi:hypothetical protein
LEKNPQACKLFGARFARRGAARLSRLHIYIVWGATVLGHYSLPAIFKRGEESVLRQAKGCKQFLNDVERRVAFTDCKLKILFVSRTLPSPAILRGRGCVPPSINLCKGLPTPQRLTRREKLC